MSDRFYLGVSADERVGYDECDPSGKELRRKLVAGDYPGGFKLRVEPGTPASEVRAFFPEEAWPGVGDFRIYIDLDEIEAKTLDELMVYFKSHRCETCGEWVDLGDWPFCKGGHGRGKFYASQFEARWFKHLDPKPVWVDSARSLDREMKARGLAHLSDFPATDAEKAHVEWSREERARRRHG